MNYCVWHSLDIAILVPTLFIHIKQIVMMERQIRTKNCPQLMSLVADRITLDLLKHMIVLGLQMSL